MNILLQTPSHSVAQPIAQPVIQTSVQTSVQSPQLVQPKINKTLVKNVIQVKPENK